MRSMNAALWQVGWGYYLSNMVGFDGTGLTTPILAWARDHFVNHVRSGGPYPALRCGRQPYGVLPVTSLDPWKPPAGQEQAFASDSWLRDLLLKLRNNIWRPRTGDAFRIGRRSPSAPDADLADIMRMDAIASGYSARSMLGRHYLQHLRAFLGEDLQGTGFIATHDALAAGVLQRLGIAWRPRLSPHGRLRIRLGGVGAAGAGRRGVAVARPRAELHPDAAGSAQHRSPDAGAARSGSPTPRRQPAAAPAAPRAAARAGRRRRIRGAAAPTPRRSCATPSSSISSPINRRRHRRRRGRGVSICRRPASPATRPCGNTSKALNTFDTPATAALGDFRRSLTWLKDRDSETLQYLMQGTLDLSSHRLDAWITSFATKRLATMTAGGPQGAYVGAYGWVEKLKPTPASSVTAVTTPPTGETTPLVTRNNDPGFIHAPSMTHAGAAALLRNAHLGPNGTPTSDSPFAIDLSSRRVRAAQRLLDGVRQGQPLGALLGFRLERGLHDTELDVAIAGLRGLAPLAARPLDDGGGAIEAIAANNVVDGLALAQLVAEQQAGGHRGGAAQRNPPPLTTDQVNKLTRELDALADAIDGLSDALTAEAAYQVARGNPSRVAATLTAIAQGDAPPPELDVIRTPRTGTALTHRLMVLFSGNPVVNPGWLATNSSPRALARADAQCLGLEAPRQRHQDPLHHRAPRRHDRRRGRDPHACP